MADTVMEQENGTVTEAQEERTFTQAELDEIVKNRVAKERSKYTDYEELQSKASKFDEMEEANKTELQKATEKADALQKQLDELTKASELRNIREKVSTDTGVPINLLTGETEDDCTKQAQAILEFAKKPSYPTVKDGGEVANIPTNNKTNGQLFGEWLTESLKH